MYNILRYIDKTGPVFYLVPGQKKGSDEKNISKPCAVFILMQSVGGKSVLSRLQGVLSMMGLLIPPMSGMAYSLVSDLAMKVPSTQNEDFWSFKDANQVS
jgi:hypothetical protein